MTLTPASGGPGSALSSPPKFLNSGALTPDFYAINTMQPPYQPSAVPPAKGGDPAYADPSAPNLLPPQNKPTIGDLLTAKGVSWAWYAGAWQAALDKDKSDSPDIRSFSIHHQPFNYFSNYAAPGTTARAEHLRDGGVNGEAFLADIRLPARLPHRGVLQAARQSQQASGLRQRARRRRPSGHRRRGSWSTARNGRTCWCCVTYDENGRLLGSRARRPRPIAGARARESRALIISPFARHGAVDHTQYDTTAAIRFITRRFGLPELDGITARDAAAAHNGSGTFGDLTPALDLKM